MSRLCRGNAPHFCANCGSTFEAKTDEDLLQNAVSPPPASGDVELTCPFCREGDFDAMGLKHHLRAGHCDAYESVASVGDAPTPGEQA